jgi:hypothetical protein
MKKLSLILIHVVFAVLLLAMACSDPIKSKIKGNWVSKDGHTKLSITDRHFAMDNDAQIKEEYFIKADTIYTSFEGNQPYTKFVIKNLEDKKLTLLDPDSLAIEFIR